MNNCDCGDRHVCNNHRRFDNDVTVDSHTANKSFVSPTPEQIDADIIGELSSLRQKVADLETAKEFNAHIHDNIIKRLNEAENKLKAIEDQFLHFIELRKIKGNG